MSLSNLTINFQTQHLSFQMLNILERQTFKVTAIIAIVCKQKKHLIGLWPATE